jgi:hypothetical protein
MTLRRTLKDKDGNDIKGIVAEAEILTFIY